MSIGPTNRPDSTFHNLVKGCLPEASHDGYDVCQTNLDATIAKIETTVQNTFRLLNPEDQHRCNSKILQQGTLQKNKFKEIPSKDFVSSDLALLRVIPNTLESLRTRIDALFNEIQALEATNEKISESNKVLIESLKSVSTLPLGVQKFFIMLHAFLVKALTVIITYLNKDNTLAKKLTIRIENSTKSIEDLTKSIEIIETYALHFEENCQQIKQNTQKIRELHTERDGLITRKDLIKEHWKELKNDQEQFVLAKKAIQPYLEATSIENLNLADVSAATDDLFELSKGESPIDITSEFLGKIHAIYRVLQVLKGSLEDTSVLPHDPGEAILNKEQALKAFTETYEKLLAKCLNRVNEGLLEKASQLLAESDYILRSATTETPAILFKQIETTLNHLESFNTDLKRSARFMRLSNPLYKRIEERIALLTQFIDLTHEAEESITQTQIDHIQTKIQNLQNSLEEQEKAVDREESYQPNLKEQEEAVDLEESHSSFPSNHEELPSDSGDSESSLEGSERNGELFIYLPESRIETPSDRAYLIHSQLTTPDSRGAIKGMQALLTTLTDYCDKGLERIEAFRSNTIDKASQLQATIENLNESTQKTELLVRLIANKNDLNQKIKDIEDLDQKIKELDASIKKQESSFSIETAHQNIQNLSNKIEEIIQKRKEIETEIADLSEKIQTNKDNTRGMHEEIKKTRLKGIKKQEENLIALKENKRQLEILIEPNQNILNFYTENLEKHLNQQAKALDEKKEQEAIQLDFLHDLSKMTKRLQGEYEEQRVVQFQLQLNKLSEADKKRLTPNLLTALERIEKLKGAENELIEEIKQFTDDNEREAIYLKTTSDERQRNLLIASQQKRTDQIEELEEQGEAFYKIYQKQIHETATLIKACGF